MTEFRLDGVLLVVATAATQIEGGCDTTNWADWAKTPGHIADGTKEKAIPNTIITIVANHH